jgi:hypothetical protein
MNNDEEDDRYADDGLRLIITGLILFTILAVGCGVFL